jgi:hypothetical protein
VHLPLAWDIADRAAPDTVPSTVRSLLPLARRWGISDGHRDTAVAAADAAALAGLAAASPSSASSGPAPPTC